MYKFFYFIVGTSLLLIFGIVMILNQVGGEFENEINEYKSLVGEKIILEKDTLLIIDYSYLKSTIKLSNGNEINFELAESLLLKVKSE